MWTGKRNPPWQLLLPWPTPEEIAARRHRDDPELCRIIGRAFAKQFGGEADEWQSVAYIEVVQARDKFDPARGVKWSTYASKAAWNGLMKANLAAQGRYKSKRGIIRRLPVVEGEFRERYHAALNVVAPNDPLHPDLAREAVQELREMIAKSPEELACLEAMLECDRSWRQRPLLARMSRSSYERRKEALRGALEIIAREMGWGQR